MPVVDEVQIDDHGRPQPPQGGSETATLTGFLDYQRATLAWKCQGLSDDQLRVTRPPSSVTLGGLLKHMAYVEDYWFTEVIAEAAPTPPWAHQDWDADPDWEWHSAGHDTGADLRALWAERVERSRAVVRDQIQRQGDNAALGHMHPAWDGQGSVSLRWVLVHMIEEYARHNGHADGLRESIDGKVGE